MDRGRAAVTWRPATADDAVALRDLEREANLVGLAHVFGELPFPDDAVLARWRGDMADPEATVLMTEVAFSSWHDAGRLRHLAVHPDHWGTGNWPARVWSWPSRTSAPLDVRRCCGAGRQPAGPGLFAHLGWEATGRERPAEWPPYPVEIELVLQESARG